MEVLSLPYPQLEEDMLGTIPVLTDNALARTSGVRVAFTGQKGGVSEGVFRSLNLGGHVGDDPVCVAENRRRVAEAFGVSPKALLGANQVHGTELVEVHAADEAALAEARRGAEAGADGLVITAPGILGLLCFADCTPIIVVAPSGSYALAHGGWRGTVGHIARKAVERLCALEAVDPSEVNVYVGPHIRQCCFEVGPDVAQQFADEFGAAVVSEDNRVSLAEAVKADVQAAGVDARRIIDAGICTRCASDRYYSYRATEGRCGRHGALACKGV